MSIEKYCEIGFGSYYNGILITSLFFLLIQLTFIDKRGVGNYHSYHYERKASSYMAMVIWNTSLIVIIIDSILCNLFQLLYLIPLLIMVLIVPIIYIKLIKENIWDGSDSIKNRHGENEHDNFANKTAKQVKREDNDDCLTDNRKQESDCFIKSKIKDICSRKRKGKNKENVEKKTPSENDNGENNPKDSNFVSLEQEIFFDDHNKINISDFVKRYEENTDTIITELGELKKLLENIEKRVFGP